MDAPLLPNSTRRSTCPYCGVGCGVLLQADGAGGLTVRGDPDHPANRGRLCSKGSALGETLSLDDRLLTPMMQGEPVHWDTALQTVADRFRATIRDHGADSVAFYVSGQLLTEDYYVANKLMKGFIGSANIDTNSRLCMASTVAGHKRAFGSDTVPGTYEDLEEADLVVLTGSNLAWCHPVLFQRLAAAKAARPHMRVVVIDPRRTATCELADLHLPIAPGSDVALWNSLLAQILRRGAVDRSYVTAHTSGLLEAVEAAQSDDPAITGLSPAQIARFHDLWIGTTNVVTVFSQGVNQSTSGSDKVNAILNCHLATGRIGRPGMGPLSVTGQPNAMGGREVGGLANMLACHLDIEAPEHRNAVRGFWDAPTIPTKPGLKAVDMFRAVASGQIKALWIMCTNPAVSMPEANAVRDAIAACDFVVVSDLTAQTDTARLADVLLPATGWAEKSGTVTNSDRTISRQRAALPAPGQARADWDIIAEVGRRMGWTRAFDYASPAEIFREYAALSGIAGRLGRDFDISGLADLSDGAYEALAPTRWPVSADRKGGRFFAEGGFFTSDRRARMLPLRHRPPAAQPGPGQVVLNTGRVRDQWHTMTRTAMTPRLMAHMAEPYLEVHPSDMARLGLSPAGIARVTGQGAEALLRVMASDKVAPGQVFAPMHWTAETASAGRIDALVPAATDPVSGQPESKAAVVDLADWDAGWFGFVLSRNRPEPGQSTGYWARARVTGGWQVEVAAQQAPMDPVGWLQDLVGASGAVEVLQVEDRARGLTRLGLVENGRLIAALFAAPEPVALARSAAIAALGQPPAAGVLAGRTPADRPDPGATVCACLGVGVNTIAAAVRDGGLIDVAQITQALGAGGECGSCKPELQQILLRHTAPRRVAAE